jgi:hypothetical protein
MRLEILGDERRRRWGDERKLVSDASTSPQKRTSPSRPDSATAIAFFSLATSIPIKASL